MPDSSSRGNFGLSSGLLLRVSRPGGHAEEFYVAGGLTIGRTEANTIVLDDEAVDRTHARVEMRDGAARLGCVGPDGSLGVGESSVRELALRPGLRFRVGRAEFECLPGRPESSWGPVPAPDACPFCDATGVEIAGEVAVPCPACRGLILPIRPGPGLGRPDLVPAEFGAYTASRFVARGGMGLVLRGNRAATGPDVAIKIFPAGTGPDRDSIERFEREVAMLTRVVHPNVVKLLDHGKSGRFRFIVMEWVPGPSLGRAIAEAGWADKLVEFGTAIRWFEQVSKGLAAMHSVGLVHRDIKPSNILVGADGEARVADLGIARRVDAASTSFTATGQAPGTMDYMAPEQVVAPDTVDGRADLYALGVTFYELLAGSRPVGAWRPPSEINPTVPRWFDELLVRLLARDREQRPRDIHELIAACLQHSRTSPATVHRQNWFSYADMSSAPHGARPFKQEDPAILYLAMMLKWAMWGGMGFACVSLLSSLLGGHSWFTWRVLLLLLGTGIFGATVASALWLGITTGDFPIPYRFALPFGSFAIVFAASWQANVGGSPMPPIVFVVVFATCVVTILRDYRWLSPAEVPTLVERGRDLRGCFDDRLALASLNKAIAMEPDYAGAFLERAVLLLRHTYSYPAERFRSAFREPGQPIKDHAEFQAFAKRMKCLAIADLSEAIRLDPTYAEAYFHRGSIYLTSKWVNDQDVEPGLIAAEQALVIADLSEAIRLDPGNAEYRYKRAFEWEKDDERTLCDLNEAIRLDRGSNRSRSAEFREGRSRHYMQLGEWDRAIADLDDAIRLRPNDPFVYYQRAMAYDAMGDQRRSQADRLQYERLHHRSLGLGSTVAWEMRFALDRLVRCVSSYFLRCKSDQFPDR